MNSHEMREHITGNGFEFIGIGYAKEDFQREFHEANCFRRAKLFWATVKDTARAMEEFGMRHSGRFQLLLLDVVNSDSVVPYVGLKAGVPIITFCSGYTARLDLRYPPAVWCDRIPSALDSQTLSEKLGNLLRWAKTLFSKLVLRHFRGRNPLMWLVFAFAATVTWNYRRKAKTLGARFCLGDWGIRLDAPEIALAVKSVDWPILQRSSTRLYMNRVAVPRMEFRGVDWRSGMDLEKPLVYCSLGANIGEAVWKDHSRKVLRHWSLKLKRYLDVVVAAAAGHPDWQILIAAGHLDEALTQNAVPPNVRVLRWVPQDDVLRRAAVMLTAGGSATLRDCLFFGVPMVVVPLWGDQFGNAARVVFHKLGYIVNDYRKLTAEALALLVEGVMKDSEVAASLADKRKGACIDDETVNREFVLFVERHTGVKL